MDPTEVLLGDGLHHGQGLVRSVVLAEQNRSLQGETFSYSVDGRNWTNATHGTTFGWENYGPYTGVAMDAWHSVEYGWSHWIRLDTPVQARFVRFQWDGDNDLLYEVDIDFAQAGPLQASLSCLRGEPVCTATASGGHAGGYVFDFGGTGITGGQQFDSSAASTFIAFCTPGASFTVTVDVTDSHGRTVTRSTTDRCTGPF